MPSRVRIAWMNGKSSSCVSGRLGHVDRMEFAPLARQALKTCFWGMLESARC